MHMHCKTLLMCFIAFLVSIMNFCLLAYFTYKTVQRIYLYMKDSLRKENCEKSVGKQDSAGVHLHYNPT